MNKNCVCEECKKSFQRKSGTQGRFCSLSCSGILENKKRKEIKIKEYLNNPNFCFNCGEILDFEKKKNKFCSRSCSAKKSNEKRKKIKRVKQRFLKHGKFAKIKRNCIICQEEMISDRKTCSYICLSKLLSNCGKKSANLKIKRSKDEIQLFELCKLYFTNVHHNEIILEGWDADIVIPNFKIAIMWNGPWHYKQMPHKNHSLKQVQRRDKIKKELFEKNGWTVLSFEDKNYTPIQAFENIKEHVK